MGKWRDKSLKGSDYFKIGLGLAAAGTGLGAAGVGPMAGLFGSSAAGAAGAGAAGVGGAAAGVGGTAGGIAGLFGPAAGSLGAELGGAAAITPMVTAGEGLAGLGASSTGLFSGASMGKALKGLNAFQQFVGAGQPVAPPAVPNRPFPNPADSGGSFTDAYRKKKPQPGDPDYLTWMLTHGNG